MQIEKDSRRAFLKNAALLSGAVISPGLRAQVTQTTLPGDHRPLKRIGIQALSTVPLGDVSLGGTLGDRYQKNIGYLLWRYKDIDRLLFPFEHRDQWLRVADWDGEYAGKWLEAAVLTASSTRHAALTEACSAVADRLRKTQQSDGYLGTELPANRLRPWWPLWAHWLAMKALREHGQRFDAAASLQAAVRGGEWILNRFYPITAGSSPFFQGEPLQRMQEINRSLLPAAEGRLGTLSVVDELVELYAITGDARYLDCAAQTVDHCPSMQKLLDAGKILPGHAYNMMTYLGAAVRVATARADKVQLNRLQHLWRDIAENHLFPTGSVSTDERLKDAPADRANAHQQETCATVEWITLSHRLYLATGDVKFANMIERTVRNALLAAQSSDGKKWAYYTPLRSSKAWFIGPTDCCFFSGPRGIARLPQLLYHLDATGVRVDLFESSRARVTINDTAVDLAQETDYPVSGAVKVRVEPQEPIEFTLKLRLPEHCENSQLRINGQTPALSTTTGSYAAIRRTWRAGDVVDIKFQPQTWVASLSDGSGVVMRGVEALAANHSDNSGDGADFEKIRLPRQAELHPAERSTDGRARYRTTMQIAERGTPVLLTPFAQAGNAAVGLMMVDGGYRTAFPKRENK